MTPEKQQTRNEHTRGIGEILDEDTPKEQQTTLGSTEQAVGPQMLSHVMPKKRFCDRHRDKQDRRTHSHPQKYCRGPANKVEKSSSILCER
jgi:hypothetical protein